MVLVRQLFYKVHYSSLAIVPIHIANDLLITSGAHSLQDVFRSFHSTLKAMIVVPGSGTLKFYGASIIQSTNYSLSVDAEEKQKP